MSTPLLETDSETVEIGHPPAIASDERPDLDSPSIPYCRRPDFEPQDLTEEFDCVENRVCWVTQ